MNKTSQKSENTSVKDAMKEFYAAEKLRRANAPSFTANKPTVVKKDSSPSSVATSKHENPNNKSDDFGTQLSKLIFGTSGEVSSEKSSISDTSGTDKEEITFLQGEVSSLQTLLEDSMATLMSMNEKLVLEQQNSAALLTRAENAEGDLEELIIHMKSQDEQIAAMHQEITRLNKLVATSDILTVNKAKVNPEHQSGDQKSEVDESLPFEELSSLKKHATTTAANDSRLTHIREKVTIDLRNLGEQLCDTLVEADDADFDLLQRHPSLQFVETDPEMLKKIFSPKTTQGNGEDSDFMFGMPSARFKVRHRSIRENEHSDDEEADEQQEDDEEYIDYGAEAYSSPPPQPMDKDIAMLEFGF